MEHRVEVLRGLDLRMGAAPWEFARSERSAIDAHWRRCLAANHRLWNGDVLICTAAAVADGILTARFAVCDYASFIAWRDWGWPDPTVTNCFGVPAVTTSDGALLFGVMGRHTLNAGLAYPPSGSLEVRDVMATGVVDVRQSMATELAEETGLDPSLASRGLLMAIFEGPRLAVVEEFAYPMSFAEMEQVYRDHTVGEAEPELDRIEAIRSTDQIDRRMPGYAQEIVRVFLGR